MTTCKSFLLPMRAMAATVVMAATLGIQAQVKSYPTPASTVCNPDGTVTFLYKNDKARKVEVDVQFAGRHAMTRDNNTGMWTVTLGPAAPDMYPYHFEVDRKSVV